jgi:polyferredoxin/ferredoxin
MSRRRTTSKATLARRCAQVVFLLLFLGLFLLARPSPVAGARPSELLKSFFFIDPLILVATFLAAHAVPAAALLALVVIGVTIVMGRVFCGWVCPLGTIHAVAGRLFDRWQRRRKRRDHWSPWQRGKYYLLIGLLVMAALGVHWVCVLDPLVLLYRTSTVALLPAGQRAVEEGRTAVFQADPRLGPLHLTAVSEPVYDFLRDHVFVAPYQTFFGSGLIALLFAAMLLLNGYRRRFWCRYLCPLGALLGFFAWRPMLRRSVEKESCNECDLCAMACHGAAAAAPGDRWKAAECLGCLNCTTSCVPSALGFRWDWPWQKQPGTEGVDLSKRAALGAAVGGLAALCLLRSTPGSRRLTVVQRPKVLGFLTYDPELIRPPGARPEREFLQRCTACGLCMKVCPTGGLQPAISEAGLEGLWTPRLVPQIGFCVYNCNLCGQVCPTGAIEPLELEAKQKVRIGLAYFDTTRCLPYAYGRDCITCEEVCPLPKKAIYTIEAKIKDSDGAEVTVKQPRVDVQLCIGCGQCEWVCVFRDRPAIRVASANETRNAANQPELAEEGPY